MQSKHKEADMGLGKGALLWLIGIPLPIILLLALVHESLALGIRSLAAA